MDYNIDENVELQKTIIRGIQEGSIIARIIDRKTQKIEFFNAKTDSGIGALDAFEVASIAGWDWFFEVQYG